MKFSAKTKSTSVISDFEASRGYQTPKKYYHPIEETTIKQDKRQQLKRKKLEKFQDSISICCGLILSGNIGESIQKLKILITGGQFLKYYEFKGMGNMENWKGQYLNQSEWISKIIADRHSHINPFDLLSVCFMLHLQSRSITIEDILNIYFMLAQQLRSSQGRFEIQVGLGNAYYNIYQIKQAQEQYTMALKEKQTQNILQYLAIIKGKKFHQNEEENRFWDKVIKINKDNIRAQLHKVAISNQYTQSLNILRKLSLENPRNCEILMSMATICRQSDQFQNYFQKTIKINPYYIQAYIIMIEKLFMVDSDRVRGILAKVLTIEPLSPEAYFWLAQLEHSQGNFQLEQQYLEKSIELNPLYFPSLKNLAQLMEEDNKIEKAINLYKKYIDLNPYDEVALSALASIYEDNQFDQNAIELLKKAININPNSIQIILRIADLHQKNGQFDDSLRYYFEAHMMDFDNANACFGLATCYYNLDNIQEAKTWAQKCIEKGADDEKEVYYLLGDIQFDEKDVYSALQWYLQHTCVTKKLNTQYIMTNIIDNFDKQTSIEMLQTICLNAPRNSDSVILILQIAKLFIELDVQSHAIRCYDQIKNFIPEVDLPEDIRAQFNNVYGDISNGFYSIKDQERWKSYKKLYSESFKKIYNQKK